MMVPAAPPRMERRSASVRNWAATWRRLAPSARRPPISDDVAFAPLTAVQDTLTGYGSINQIVVQAKSTQQLSAAQTEVTQILNQVAPPAAGSASASNFNVINQGSI